MTEFDIESEPNNLTRPEVGEQSNMNSRKQNNAEHKKQRRHFTLKSCIDIGFSVFFRLIYLVEASLVINFLFKVKSSWLFLLLILPLVLIIVDGFYVAVFRHGIEHPWYNCTAFFNLLHNFDFKTFFLAHFNFV